MIRCLFICSMLLNSFQPFGGAAVFSPGIFYHIFPVVSVYRYCVARKHIIQVAVHSILIDIDLLVLFADDIRISCQFKILEQVAHILGYFFGGRAVKICDLENLCRDIPAGDRIAALVDKECEKLL